VAPAPSFEIEGAVFVQRFGASTLFRKSMGATMLSHDFYVQGEAHLRAEPQRHFWVFAALIVESLIVWMGCLLGLMVRF
jgi:hypothetical protein